MPRKGYAKEGICQGRDIRQGGGILRQAASPDHVPAGTVGSHRRVNTRPQGDSAYEPNADARIGIGARQGGPGA
jgi:hypothetical protein